MRLEFRNGAVLIDCGMFQGSKTEKQLNYGAFPFKVDGIDAVLVTHAHIDHTGLLPKLSRAGYSGPIYATPGTIELCGVMLADAANIQEMEVEQLNRRNERQGVPAVTPIYTRADAEACMALFRAARLNAWTQILPGLRARWWNAGHILGSASIEVEVSDGGETERLLFSGDIGPGDSAFVDDPEGPSSVDHIVMESTYGAAVRAKLSADERRAKLIAELQEAHAAGGPLLIPAFAIERTQELVIDLLQAMDSGLAPRGPIFVDSPLAIRAMEIFLRNGRGEDGGNPFLRLRESSWLQFTESVNESSAIERVRGWHIIIAASGMCDAGRVRHHLKRLLWRDAATVMLVGYQAVGTLGRLLRDGEHSVRIQGEHIEVHARIRTLDIYSGHTDANGLLAWAKARAPIRGGIFLTHGEDESRDSLRTRLIQSGLVGDQVIAPALDQGYQLKPNAPPIAESAAPSRLPPEAPGKLDWHNARVAFLEALNAKLKAAASDKAREAILADLTQRLAG
jgi:metallo-beta-lactamase family protein